MAKAFITSCLHLLQFSKNESENKLFDLIKCGLKKKISNPPSKDKYLRLITEFVGKSARCQFTEILNKDVSPVSSNFSNSNSVSEKYIYLDVPRMECCWYFIY